MPVLLGSIPSPSSGNVHLGPFTIHMYGLMLLLGIAGAIWLTGKALDETAAATGTSSSGPRSGASRPASSAHALYHVITSWSELPHAWWGPFAVWQGGLGIWGGIFLGVVAGAVVVRRAGASVTLMMDCVAPGLLLAQAIGRWGNYWNQELFGKPTEPALGRSRSTPTTVPWAIRVRTTFHPTFLYESLYDLAGVGAPASSIGAVPHQAAGLFALYVSYYTFGRTSRSCCGSTRPTISWAQRVNFWVVAGRLSRLVGPVRLVAVRVGLPVPIR